MESREQKEIAARQRLKDDYDFYARNCLFIRGKDGKIEAFSLNKAQKYVHAKVEHQRAATGKIRCLILKGRQQGMCFSPDMRVLTADYKWKTIDELEVGERLVACDENSPGRTKTNRKQTRKFRTSILEVKREFYKQTYEVLFDNGARLNVTPDHRMLCKKRSGDDQQWRHVSDFKIGDLVRIATRPPNYQCNTYEDGWMGGMLDGEGSIRTHGAKRISVHQVEGKVLDRLRRYFEDIDMPYLQVIDARTDGINKKGRKPVFRFDIGRLPYIMELMARCRPTRFVDKEWHVGHELPGKSAQDGIKPWAKVISIKPLERQRVIDIQTSTKTFICEGLVSHNSTYIEGRFYWRVTHSKGMRAFILTHEEEATNNLFEMAKRYHDNCPIPMKHTTKTSNAKELVFDKLDSGYKLGTAGNKSVGRSSTIQFLHASEAAFYKHADQHAKGIMQTVPNANNTEIFLESTANGVGNWFHQQWQLAESGQSDYIAIFVPWFWQDEYTKDAPSDFKLDETEILLRQSFNLSDGQLAWRRMKIIELSVNGMDGEKAFHQEYPCIAQEAFTLTGEDNYLDTAIVLAARKSQQVESYGSLVLGVDPARFGDDRTAIIRRQGRKAHGLETHIKKDTMEITGIVHQIILAERPNAVCVDIGGLGAGVYDRLCELGHRHILHAINAGAKPLDAKKYINKRAEMWGTLKQWLTDQPCQIPDSDELHADLCNVKYKVDSVSRLVIEPKADMKKRGVRSSDCADAIMLTLAIPESQIQSSKSAASDVAQQMAASQAKMDAIRLAQYKR